MEITYQNKNEDLDAYSDYSINETEAGKKYSLRMLLISQVTIFIIAVVIGGITLLISGLAKDGVFWGVLFLFVLEFSIFFKSSYKPRYHMARIAVKKEINSRSEKDKLSFLLPRKCIINDDWIEIQNPESSHRWKWKIIEKIALRPDYIYIHANSYYVFMIPKRDFASEQDFIDFSNKIWTLIKNVGEENHNILLSPKPVASSEQYDGQTQKASEKKRNTIYTLLFILIGILLCCGLGIWYGNT